MALDDIRKFLNFGYVKIQRSFSSREVFVQEGDLWEDLVSRSMNDIVAFTWETCSIPRYTDLLDHLFALDSRKDRYKSFFDLPPRIVLELNNSPYLRPLALIKKLK